MDFTHVVRGQFEGALSMLTSAIRLSDEDLWLAAVGDRAFWELAYHATFYTHLYLSKDLASFEGIPDFARPESAGLGRRPEPPFEACDPGPPVDRMQTLAYVRAAREKLIVALSLETDQSLEDRCGFPWLMLSRAELYLYNLRHVQHHTAQLHIALRRSGKCPNWNARGWIDVM